jgi:ABC-type transport system involved in multi-copper enzyme maturation permease subunit
MVLYFSLALLATASAGASSIAGERQAGTWPVLMTLALDERQVLTGKILGSIMRVWPFWLVLLAHLFVFTILRCIHYVAIPYLLVLFAASSLLVSTIAVFISSSFKRISTAQITTLICIILFGSPLCCGLPTFLVSPVTIATIILGTSAGHETAVMPVSKLQLFLAKGYYGLLANSVLFAALISIYLLITYVFYGLTHNKLRNKIF